MTSAELRASLSLASLYGLRMFGLFVILPVFAIYSEQLRGGGDLLLVGAAIGAYGLVQGLLQIPFGLLSDRWGRKPLIYTGLVLFAAGSFIAAAATDIWIVILGRAVQGAGAISAAVIAMLADLTRDEVRTKAMALIGSSIGATFALSLILSPWLNHLIGVPGIFALTGVLVVAAIPVVAFVVPPEPARIARRAPPRFREVLLSAELLRLNWGVFALHAILMALFIAVPLSLRDAGLPLEAHWKVYLPVMLASFACMLPAVFLSERKQATKRVFVGAIALLAGALAAMPWVLSQAGPTVAFLVVFFTAFNVLEALLPSLATRFAPVAGKGAAIGIYSTVQFLGTFVGAAVGGYLFQRHGAWGLTVFLVLLAASWLAVAGAMRVPARAETRSYPLAPDLASEYPTLSLALERLPGVQEVLISETERVAHLKVDAARFDEQNALKLIGGQA
ncbi:MAG: MFS transporter [Burkholderiales bacterium]